MRLKWNTFLFLYKIRKVLLIISLALYMFLVFKVYNADVRKSLLYLNVEETNENNITYRNLSFEYITKNNYAPVKGAGKEGRSFELTSGETVFAKGLYAFQGYNVLVSDRISINRSLPDMRSESCKKIHYNLNYLPSASIIIVFYNEVWSALMRTVVSILNYSQDQFIKEILLVDDGSERQYLTKDLDDAVAKFTKVRIIRYKLRKGLVGARLEGAKSAAGDIFLFLDAHCEVTTGWLEPLIYQASRRNVYACPHINNINADTLEYTNNIDEQYGVFSWQLAFRWSRPGRNILEALSKNSSMPYATPVMAGGLFAVKKTLFWKLGGYDDGLQIWGSENLELSWKAWQCGSRIEVVPCSRVGHIFRTKSPYNFPGVQKVHLSNLARVSLVWMDKWANFVFKVKPSLNDVKSEINVTERIQLRKQLKCRGFEWYLKKVWPTHFFPTDDRWFGMIKNNRGACLGLLQGTAFGVDCVNETIEFLLFTSNGKIVSDDDFCLEQGNNRAFWNRCQNIKKQTWRYSDLRLKTLYGSCLTLVSRKTSKRKGVNDLISVKKCVEDVGQIWHFIEKSWY